MAQCSAQNIGRPDKFGDKGGAGKFVDLFGGADLLDFALVVHDRHLVGDSERLELIMGDVDEGRFELVLQLDQLDQHPFAQLEVKGCQGLIEKEDIGLVDDGAGKRDALLLAAGELAGQLIDVIFEMKSLEDFKDLLLDDGLGSFLSLRL